MLVADVAGPDVGGTIGDIFDWYVSQAAQRIGFAEAQIRKAEERIEYHNLEGSVHCATNVIREVEGNWWD
jgi:hypothetical protein